MVLPPTPINLSTAHVYEIDEEENHLLNSFSLEDVGESSQSRLSDPTDTNDGDSSEAERSVPSLTEDGGGVVDDDDDNEIDAAMDEVFEQDEEGEADADDQVIENPVQGFGNFLLQDAATKASSHGGLSNLGNTCYMASALQMMASLEPFVESIQTSEPANLEEDDTKLRKAFLDLLSRLGSGETIRPDDFKDAVDERSSLFLGYRQQDSHEFLTTLLDLLDEDYLPKKEQEEERPSTVADIAMESTCPADVIIHEEEEEQDDSILETSPKKARTEEYAEDTPKEEPVAPTCLRTRQSFSELDVDDIGQLLHGAPPCHENLVFPAHPDSPSQQIAPRYKLAGGRMNTTDVVLIPYELNAELAGAAAPMDEETGDCTSVRSISSSDSEPAVISPVDDYLKTFVRVRLTCDSCKYTRTHTETFLHLSLEIGPNSGSVDEGLRRFFAPEQREIKCEKCFCETATQNMEITKLPRALLLHFKRFIVDVSPDYTSVTYRKNQSAVIFYQSLSLNEDTGVLTEFLAPDCENPDGARSAYQQELPPQSYSIRSVVHHIGSSASCGHYTADAYRRVKDDDDAEELDHREWMRFNDSYVTTVTPKEAVQESFRTAYMILYELE